jgi:hypothetical protein
MQPGFGVGGHGLLASNRLSEIIRVEIRPSTKQGFGRVVLPYLAGTA